ARAEVGGEAGVGTALGAPALPVGDGVRGACELLGLDPLHIANEGQFLAVLERDGVDRAIDALRAVDGGGGATIIGEVAASDPGTVIARSGYGSARIADMLVGDPLPRIC